MEHRQQQIQRLHRRIREYQPTSQQLRHLERTHLELQTAIQHKYGISKANAIYRFPLSHHLEPSLHDVDPCGTVYNLYSQNPVSVTSKVRLICSSLENPIRRGDSSLDRDSLGFKTKHQLETSLKARTKKNVNSAVKRLKTEGECFNKENQPLEKASLSKKAKLSSNHTRLNTTQYNCKPKKPKKVDSKLKQKDLYLCLNESADALVLSQKIQPTSVGSSKLKCDFTQSYQFQGLSKLADQTRNCDRLSEYSSAQNRMDASIKNRKKQQFPHEKMYNDLQMKLLTNRMSQEGKSVKSNFRLLLQADTPTHHRQLHSRFTNR